MRLHYLSKDGDQKSIELDEKPLTIGRSADADVLILDEKASRVHCGIRFWDGEFYIKDLKSKNGTFVNEKRVDIHPLVPGDKIRVGASTFVFETTPTGQGANTAIMEMQDAFNGGKGYSTILREIVEEVDEPPMTPIPVKMTETSKTPVENVKAAGEDEPTPADETNPDSDDVIDRPTIPSTSATKPKKVVRRRQVTKVRKKVIGTGTKKVKVKIKKKPATGGDGNGKADA